MKKKVLSVVLCASMLATMFAGCGTKENGTEAGSSKKDSDKVINIYAFTDEVPNMFKKYKELHPDFDYDFEVTVISTTDGAYQPALDTALQDDKTAPDIYTAEAAFVVKYASGAASKYACPYADLGIDVDNKIKEAEIAQYSVDIGTNKDGKVVGLGYQATGGAFIYRRSIAKDVFGTDDPATITKEIGPGWDKFYSAADKLKAKGYAAVSGDGDIWHAIENSSDKGWVENGKLVIDSKREAFLDASMKLKENGYHNDTQDWQDAWFADMNDSGPKKVFGFFGPAWLINYTLGEHSKNETAGTDTKGDWAACESPVGFFWGGTWLFASKQVANSPKKEAVAKLIEWVTLDTSENGLQYLWANGKMNDNGTKDSVASGKVMAASDGTCDFLGGQNMFDAFIPANKNAKGDNLTEYDEKINQIWRDQTRLYTGGEKSKEDAIKDFKQQVKDALDIKVD